MEEKQTIIRRARGFAPEPFKALNMRDILSVYGKTSSDKAPKTYAF